MIDIMKKLVLGLICSVLYFGSFAQSSREYIRQQITNHGTCKNVAITKTNGDAMLYGKNGWAAHSCPIGLTDALREFNRQNVEINDIVLTEAGSWLVLFGGNGVSWHDIPYSLERKMKTFHENQEIITSITYNDGGNWIIISTEHYSASDDWILDWLKEGADEFGQLWAACVTDDAMVAVYSNGYRFYGNVPQSLKDALDKTYKDIYRIKIAGSAWFIADKNGWYDYRM